MKDSRDLAGLTPQRSTDYAGRPIGPLRLARAMNVNIAGGTCIMMTLAVLWPNAAITAVFLKERLGASSTLIGLSFTLVGLATVSALPGAWFFSRIHRRREIWVVLTTFARLFMAGPAVVALLAHRTEWHNQLIWAFMICLLGMQLGGVFTSPGWWAWMADLIPASMWGNFFGRRWKWMLLGQSAIAISAGRMLDWAGEPGSDAQRYAFFAIFAVAAALALIDPLLFCLVPEPVRAKPRRRSFIATAREYWRPIQNRGFLAMLVSAGIYVMLYNLPLVFFPLFLRGEQIGKHWIGGHASIGLLSLVMVVFAVSTAVAANQWGRLADRIGHRIVWILSSFGFFAHLSFFFINERNYAWLALLNALVYGAGFAGQQVAAQNMALSMAPPRKREFYTSLFLAVVNMLGGIGPLVGGLLADRYRIFESIHLPSGQPASYIHLLLAIAFVGMLLNVLLMVRVPDEMGTAVRPWFGRMLTGDLFRVAYNISVLGTALAVPRRVRAIRRISRRDGNLMLPEIVAALDDSDTALRREALLALGRLGTPESLDLLRWYLYDPDASMRAHSVEAIGHALSGKPAENEPPGSPGLLRRALHDPDSRVRRAAVVALSRVGDRGAATELRSLLTDEHDGEVLGSVAAALSRLKEFGAIREMVNLALNSDNSTVRAQMLVALADLLGESSDFHKLWRQDRHWRGTGFAKLARRLRRQAHIVPQTEVHRGAPTRAENRALSAALDAELESFLQLVEAEDWRSALAQLWRISLRLLEMRFRYHGDEAHALEFVSAVSPGLAQRYWLVTYLQHSCEPGVCTESPWDGLTLLAIYALAHG